MGLSGISTWGSDIGGFFALGDRSLTPELLKRWVQFGAVSGVMRTQANGIAVPDKPRPQVWDDDQLPHWRRYAKLRTQLYPYLVAADAEYRAHRPADHAPPGARLSARPTRAARRDDEFLFGPDLLAAPVVEPGATAARALPAARALGRPLARGRLPSGAAAACACGRRASSCGGRERDRARAARRAAAAGPRRHRPAAAARPTSTRSRHTARVRGLVPLSDRRDRMQLLAFPRGRSSSRFFEGERLVSREGRKGWRLTVLGKRRRSYSLQASLETLERRLVPCRVTLDGRKLNAVSVAPRLASAAR